MPNTHQLKPGKSIQLDDISTEGKEIHENRDAAEKDFVSLRHKFIELQPKLYAEGKQKLLIVLQAMDAGGKDGTTRKVFRGVNPQGVRVTSFKKPTEEELAHDFLWRIHKAVPAKGMIGVFNRSHYEDVLVVRVDGLLPKAVWSERYEIINQFERLLTESNTTILKFFLHISKKEQKERFQARLDDPTKHWKFSKDDLRKRDQWEQYQEAYEDALNRCTTKHAPWYVIPADQKWYRNLAIMRVIVSTLNRMNPKYPDGEDEVTGVTID